jgi:hypothetical protein
MGNWKEVEGGNVWKPETVGDKLDGTIKSREQRQGQNNQEYTSFTIVRFEDGEEIKTSGKGLEDKLKSIPDGTRILLTYKGKEKTKSGFYVKTFSVMTWDEEDKPEL